MSGSTLPSGYWPIEKSQPIVDKPQTIRLSAESLNHLSEGERRAVPLLLEVGKIFQSLYEQQRHPDAVTAHAELKQLDRREGSPAVTQNLLTLYRLNQGPIAVTLENMRDAFLPVDGVQPGKNVYPWAVKKDAIESFFSGFRKSAKSCWIYALSSNEQLQKMLTRTWPNFDNILFSIRFIRD